MTIKEAAIRVLKEADGPLSVDEIWERIAEKNLYQAKGKTPKASLSASIYMDIKKKGEKSPFIKTGPRTFGLRPSDRAFPDDKGLYQPQKRRKKDIRVYSFADAAEKVLEEFSDNKPMHYKEITEKALEKGWLKTQGKTPDLTMYAQILTEIKRHKMQGKPPRFIKHGKGLVGLSKWLRSDLDSQIEQHNEKVKKALHNKLLKMNPFEFEELIARLLAEMGFEEIEVTNKSGDGGIDVRGTLVVGDAIKIRMAVQAKRWKGNVQSKIVQQVRGSLGTHEQGLIITTSDFSKGAKNEASQPNKVPIDLMNGKQLVALMVEYGIGVKKRSHDLLELEEEENITSP